MNDIQRKQILVVDDEPQITRVLRTTLTANGYGVRTAGEADEALEIMREWQPDLVITDLAMPNMSGLQLCQRIRTKSQVPIIFLSVRGEEKTKIEALDAGADDYVTKPFNMNELLARVRAALRRAGVALAEPQTTELTAGEFRVDLRTRLVTVRERELRLTPKEFDLLVYFVKHAGKVMTHRALLSAVWGANSTEQPEYLRVFINHLRKKLEPEDGSAKYIVTEPWVGYRFEPGE